MHLKPAQPETNNVHHVRTLFGLPPQVGGGAVALTFLEKIASVTATNTTVSRPSHAAPVAGDGGREHGGVRLLGRITPGLQGHLRPERARRVIQAHQG